MEKIHIEERERPSLRQYLPYMIIAVLGVFCVLLWMRGEKLSEELRDTARLAELSEYVDEKYYQDTDGDALMDSALKGYIAGLEDPYSSFLTPDEYSSWQEKESGTSVGIGVTVQAHDEGLYVVSVTEGSPAEKGGFLADDIITAVDGQLVTELGYEEAVAAVKGEIGTDVALTVDRDGGTLQLVITRGEIVTISAEGQMLPGNIGYIRISAFRENTFNQYNEALTGLIEEGAESIIFDVRDNGGGLLTSLENVLDPLLPEGDIAVASYGDGSEKTIVRSDDNELTLPMAVVMNENTASAGELFAAALSDFGKATLVGTVTYGKGVMQDTRTVAGGAATLTVAAYRTVKGECYHGVGVSPDMEVVLPEGYAVDFDEPDIESDIQLKAAYELLADK